MKNRIITTSVTDDYRIADCIDYTRVSPQLRSAALSLYGGQASSNPNLILKGSIVMLVGAAVLRAIAERAEPAEFADVEIVQDDSHLSQLVARVDPDNPM